MKRTTSLFILFSFALLFNACNRVNEKVIQYYPSGEPMLVLLEKGAKDNAQRVGERMYYQSGQLQFEKKFSGKPETPDGIWNYYWDNGQLFASGDFSQNHEYGSQWVFYNRNGGPYYDGKLDSIKVNDMGIFGTPSTVSFFSDNHQDVVQFYSNFTVRSTERLTNNLRHGKAYFYFPDGKLQVEANFVNGKEDGQYIVYHETGVPFYQGRYENGKRVGTWEFYDKEGNLVKHQDYTKTDASSSPNLQQ